MNKADLKKAEHFLGIIKEHSPNSIIHFQAVLDLLSLKNNNKIKDSYRELHEKTGITLSTLHQLAQILQYYKNDVMATLEDWQQSKRAITVYARKRRDELYRPQTEDATPYAQLKKQVTQYFKDANNFNRIHEASDIVGSLRHLIPPGKALRDRYYLEYNDCLCCGKPSMGIAFPLREVHNMLMPICDTCIKLPDYPQRILWKEVASLYYSYSQVIEEAAEYFTEKL